MKPPYNGSSDTDSGHEVFNVAVEADGDASEILDPAKGSFNDVALFIEDFIVFVLDFSVLPRWDNRLCSSCH